MGTDTEEIKKPAPTLYAIIGFKLLKGLLFVTLAVVAYTLSDNDLPAELRNVLHFLRLNPERKFWFDLAHRVGQITEPTMVRAAVGTLIYSLFSLVEGVGLMFRLSWSGWLAIGESAFFIPIEIYELVHRSPDPTRHGHPVVISGILVLNIFILWYLFQNRERLFRHHHHH
jgi:uncharacterized membrane protein (DUF2068 family)